MNQRNKSIIQLKKISELNITAIIKIEKKDNFKNFVIF